MNAGDAGTTGSGAPAAQRPQGTRRTLLAAERTLLAWVRTGLAFGAVALAVGKLVPEVTDSSSEWAYAAIGAGYALLGVIVLVYGLIRREELEDALGEGGYAPVSAALIRIVLVGSAALGAAIAAVIVLD
jgi:putative membrane protein